MYVHIVLLTVLFGFVKTATVMKCCLSVKMLCFITNWIHQYSPSFTIKNWSAMSLFFFYLILHVHIYYSAVSESRFNFSLPASPQRRLRTIFPRRWRRRSLHSPHTKHLALYSFPPTVGRSSILLPRALWDVVALYCFSLQSDYMKSYWTHPAFTFFSGSVILLCLWIVARLTVLYPPLLKRGHTIELQVFFVGCFLNVPEFQSGTETSKAFPLFCAFASSCSALFRTSSLTASVFCKISQERGIFSSLPSKRLGFCWLSIGL